MLITIPWKMKDTEYEVLGPLRGINEFLFVCFETGSSLCSSYLKINLQVLTLYWHVFSKENPMQKSPVQKKLWWNAPWWQTSAVFITQDLSQNILIQGSKVGSEHLYFFLKTHRLCRFAVYLGTTALHSMQFQTNLSLCCLEFNTHSASENWGRGD